MRLSKNEEIPMIDSNTCDFSFAGLKTAVLYMLYMLKNRTSGEINETNCSFCR